MEPHWHRLGRRKQLCRTTSNHRAHKLSARLTIIKICFIIVTRIVPCSKAQLESPKGRGRSWRFTYRNHRRTSTRRHLSSWSQHGRLLLSVAPVSTQCSQSTSIFEPLRQHPSKVSDPRCPRRIKREKRKRRRMKEYGAATEGE